jgi:outer membrane receptor for ferrienterochelin and colicins
MKKTLLKNIAFAALLFACWLSLLSGRAYSQTTPENSKDLTDIPIEDLGKLEVYSASKLNQAISEAPASITIITAADIQHFGYRTLADIIQNVTGFFTSYDRNYYYFGIRGFGRTGDYNSRVLILIDGHRLNENIYGSVGIGYDFPISIDLIERIEIVRGPGSSLYGTNAFFATMNIITKRGRSFGGAQLSAEAGGLQTYAERLSYGNKFDNGLEVAFSADYLDSKGNRRLYYPEFDTTENNNGVAQDMDTERSNKAFVNASYRGLTAQMVYYSREKGIPTASFDTAFNDRRLKTNESGAYFDIKYEKSLRDKWDFRARTSVDIYNSHGEYPYYFSPDESSSFVVNQDKASGRWWGGELQVARKIAGRHHILVGTEWRYSFTADQLNYDHDPVDYVYLDKKMQSKDSGTYLQAELAVLKNLFISAGVRRDQYSTFGGSTNPRFAAVYSPEPKTTMKLLYGHAFRAPNLYELYYEDTISSKANPKLQPENIRTTELVIEKIISKKCRISASAYHYAIDNLIIQSTDPADGLAFFHNSVDYLNANGIEFEIENKNIYRIDSRFSYALQRGTTPTGADAMVNSPRHLAQINLYMPFYQNKIGAAGEIRYMSPRKTLADSKIEGFLLTNVTLLHTRLFWNLGLSATIYNLFNKRYWDPAGTEHRQDSLLQDGRSFRIKIGVGFPGR